MLLLDKVENDLDRISRMNQILAAGEREFGPDFSARLASAMEKHKSTPYAQVQTVLIRPSQDLGRIAFETVQRTGLARYSGIIARWIRWAVQADGAARRATSPATCCSTRSTCRGSSTSATRTPRATTAS